MNNIAVILCLDDDSFLEREHLENLEVNWYNELLATPRYKLDSLVEDEAASCAPIFRVLVALERSSLLSEGLFLKLRKVAEDRLEGERFLP